MLRIRGKCDRYFGRCLLCEVLHVVVPINEFVNIVDTTLLDEMGKELVSNHLSGSILTGGRQKGTGMVHLAGLLFQSHARKEIVEALVDRKTGIPALVAGFFS